MRQMSDPRASMRAWFLTMLQRQMALKGYSQTRLAEITHTTQSNIAHYLRGRHKPTEDFARQLDIAFGTDDLFYLIWWFGAHQVDLDWWRRFTEFEARAKIIRIYQGLVVPGLLQTEAYMRAVWAVDLAEDIDDLVQRRVARQALLSKPDPPHVQVLIDELAFLRPFGGPEVMHEQMEHLISIGRLLPRLTIQVIPIRLSDHPGVNGAFQVLTLPTGDIAYVETQNGGRVVEDGAEVLDHGLRLDRIRSRALPVDESIEMVTKLMEMA